MKRCWYISMLDQVRDSIFAHYRNNPYVIMGCDRDCASILEFAHKQCASNKRVSKLVLIGTQECLESLDAQCLETLGHYGVRVEFFMQLDSMWRESFLAHYGVVFGFKNAKFQLENF